MTLSTTNPLHLYRALLRESTYLFDPIARQWIQRYVTRSFRKHAAKTHHEGQARTIPYNPNCLPSATERGLLKRGRKFLVLVERANRGYQRQLRVLLQLVYGRKGPQKRALTAPLMKDRLQPLSSTSDTRQNESSSTQITTKEFKKSITAWKAPDDFMSILSAQNQLSEYLSIRKKIKLKAPIPDTNRWGRAMPVSRVKTLSKRWYANMADATMPPVPENDWERLRAIVLSDITFTHIPRRAVAVSGLENAKANDVSYKATQILSGVHKPPGKKIMISIRNPHKLKARFLSRFYGRHILNHCPVAMPNPRGEGLISKWDSGKRTTVKAQSPTDEAQMNALFG